jgi:hypothetical protein
MRPFFFALLQAKKDKDSSIFFALLQNKKDKFPTDASKILYESVSICNCMRRVTES